MKFKYNKIKINNLNDLVVGSHSLVCVNSLFFPINSGNYFSLEYKEKTNINILNISLEDFKLIKEKKIVKSMILIEVLREDGTSTNGYLLYSKELSNQWYLYGLWTYNTNITLDEKNILINQLKEKNYCINSTISIIHKKEDIEKIIKDSYSLKLSTKYNFNYISSYDSILKECMDINVDLKKMKNIYIMKKGNESYPYHLYSLNQIIHNFKSFENFLKTNDILGYIDFSNENLLNCFILDNDKLINFLEKINKYNSFLNSSNNLTLDGKKKFYEFLNYENEKHKELRLNGTIISKEALKGYLQKIIDFNNNIEFKDYNFEELKTLNIDYDELIIKLKREKFLKSNNEKYANDNSTQKMKICVYFYELIIEEILENQIILRLSMNGLHFYYLKFEKTNNIWDFEPTKKIVTTTYNYL